MANKHMKRCSTFIRAHYQGNANQNYKEVSPHPNQNGHYQKIYKFWRGWGEKETLLHCWWEGKLIQPLWRTVQRFLKKLGIKLLYEPAIPLLGTYPQETITEKDTGTPMFTAVLRTIARIWRQPRCPSTDEWIQKLWYIYTMEYYSAIKRST